MNIESKLQAFVHLGERLTQLDAETRQNWYTQARARNNWFTPENVQTALAGIARYLQPDDLQRWVQAYTISVVQPQKVGVVMAGNIPAVGFHDMMCVLLSGHTLYAKLSSQDPFLPQALATLLIEVEPAFAAKIVFAERLNEVDAIIATGSDNSARYFQYYFGKKPHIIRQNRTSCAILTGHENPKELEALGLDIFQYFGLGCRNVSKLFVPDGYSFDQFFEHLETYREIIHHHKYVNNYDYNKSIYLINQMPHYDNGFLLLLPNEALVSPVSVVYYETYRNEEELRQKIEANAAKIQCVVTQKGWFPGSIPFGQAQQPGVWDYADGVDTMQFLLSL